MIRIRISNPVTWFEQCCWIEENCKDFEDATNWAAWQIGLDDIYYWVLDRDATRFWLRWA